MNTHVLCEHVCSPVVEQEYFPEGGQEVALRFALELNYIKIIFFIQMQQFKKYYSGLRKLGSTEFRIPSNQLMTAFVLKLFRRIGTET